MDVRYIATTSGRLSELAIVDGQLIYLTDLNATYYDMGSSRRLVSSMRVVSSLPSTSVAQEGVIYGIVNGSGRIDAAIWDAGASTFRQMTGYVATTSSLGLVKPDGTTITIDSNGTISCQQTTDLPADHVTYDNSETGLASTSVQGAIGDVKTIADNASSAASTALSTAQAASAAAAAASTVASDALSTAQSATSTASSASSVAGEALTAAQSATSIASGASTIAGDALNAAQSATSVAQSAASEAGNALSTAQSATSVASEALTTAQNATSVANEHSTSKLGDFTTVSDVVISDVTYHTYWKTAPTSSNQVYGAAVHPTSGRLCRIYANQSTYSMQYYDKDNNTTTGDGIKIKANQSASSSPAMSSSVAANTTLDATVKKLLNNDAALAARITALETIAAKALIVEDNNS